MEIFFSKIKELFEGNLKGYFPNNKKIHLQLKN